MLPSEIQTGYQMFPSVFNVTDFRTRRNNSLFCDDDEIKELSEARQPNLHSSNRDQEVQSYLERFRKTVLGVDKYRINRPGKVAKHYASVVGICLKEHDDWWETAANALQYAGLNMRDHISTSSNTCNSTNMLSLDLDSLWSQSLIRLLDLEVNQVNESLASEVWDQKYFAQVELTPTDIWYIQDMIVRIAQIGLKVIQSQLNSSSSNQFQIMLFHSLLLWL